MTGSLLKSMIADAFIYFMYFKKWYHVMFYGTVVFEQQFGDKFYMDLYRKLHWFQMCYDS